MTDLSTRTSKLNDTQLALLSAASQRQDRQVLRPETITERAFARAMNALRRLGLITAIEAGVDQSGLVDAATDEPIFAITSAGLKAIGLPELANEPPAQPKKRRREQIPPALTTADDAAESKGPATKRAMIVAMLSRDNGATLDDLIAATGWLPHTTRAALTGLRQKGFGIEREQREDRTSVYRIVASAAHEQAA